MKKAVITILGLAGGKLIKDDVGTLKAVNFKSKHDYYFNKEESLSQYSNTLPLLIDKYEDAYEVIPFFTKEAKFVQSKILIENEDKENSLSIFDDKYLIEDENNFESLLALISQTMDNYDRVIIDITHGFRHMPILVTINLIMENIKDIEKVEHIWFAKEIVKAEPNISGEYHLIDLKKYLDLASLSFMLSTFNQNYTVSNKINFSNSLYQEIAEELADFSNHFLSNSLKPLIEGSLIDDIIENLRKLQESKELESFTRYIDDIVKHLESIKAIKNENEWMKLYKLSKIMDKRGYQLNAITLLFEGTGFYCKDRISEISVESKEHIDYFENKLIGKKEPKTKYSLYSLVNQSRNIAKLSNDNSDDKFSGDYLFNPETINLTKSQFKKLKPKPKDKIKKIISDIEIHVKSCDDIAWFQDFIRDIEALRNNLAHGNSSHGIEDVKAEYKKMLKQFKTFCIDTDVLK